MQPSKGSALSGKIMALQKVRLFLNLSSACDTTSYSTMWPFASCPFHFSTNIAPEISGLGSTKLMK